MFTQLRKRIFSGQFLLVLFVEVAASMIIKLVTCLL